MEPTGTIKLQPWMAEPASVAVMAALTAEGDAARFVGGCVRNAILGRPVDDVDIATAAPPDATMRLLQKAGIKAVATGIEHGTVTAVTGKRHFEITTLRRDAETFGRKARVEYTDDWIEDARRRDFTFNALYCDADGTLYDPCDGLDDLKAGCVRFVGSPSARIAEDYLRVFRFFRFLAWYGRPPTDEEAIEAIGQAAPHLATLSGERVQKELLRLLAAPDPVPAAALMHREGVLVHWLPESPGASGLSPLLRIEKANGIAPDALRRLAAMLEADPDVDGLAMRLKFSRAAHARLATALAAEPHIVSLDAGSVRALVYRIGNLAASDRLILHAARAGIGPSHPALVAAVNLASVWQAPKFPLSGDDVLALGVAPGIDVGRLLGTVEEWWIGGGFAADDAACRAELKRLREAQA